MERSGSLRLVTAWETWQNVFFLWQPAEPFEVGKSYSVKIDDGSSEPLDGATFQVATAVPGKLETSATARADRLLVPSGTQLYCEDDLECRVDLITFRVEQPRVLLAVDWAALGGLRSQHLFRSVPVSATRPANVKATDETELRWHSADQMLESFFEAPAENYCVRLEALSQRDGIITPVGPNPLYCASGDVQPLAIDVESAHADARCEYPSEQDWHEAWCQDNAEHCRGTIIGACAEYGAVCTPIGVGDRRVKLGLRAKVGLPVKLGLAWAAWQEPRQVELVVAVTLAGAALMLQGAVERPELVGTTAEAPQVTAQLYPARRVPARALTVAPAVSPLVSNLDPSRFSRLAR